MLKDLAVFDINIFREQMMEDVDTLEYILEEVYSGFESLNKRGLSVRGMLNGLREQLSSTSVMNVAEFFDLICEALQAIRDSHLIFSLPYFDKRHSFCAHSTVYLADVILKKEGNDYFVLSSSDEKVTCGSKIEIETEYLFKASKSEFLIGKFGEETLREIPLCLNGREIGVNISPATEKTQSSGPLWKHTFCNGADIVEIRSLAAFSEDEKQELEKLVSLGKSLKDASKVIVDLRGNKGGDSEFARRFIENLNGQAVLNLNYAKRDSPGSRLAEVCFYAQSKKDYDRIRTEILMDQQSDWKVAERKPIEVGEFKNALLILTDRNTASSAEIMVKCLRDNIPQSVVIGENTSGTLCTGDIRYYYLPNSKIFLNVPTAVFSGILEEGVGLLPDYWCKGDALKFAIGFDP